MGGGVEFKEFIFHKAMRLLPMVFIATMILQMNFCIYYLLYGEVAFGPIIDPVGNMVSLWRLICASLGIDCGWTIVMDSEYQYVTWYVSVLMLCYLDFYVLTFLAKRIGTSPIYMYIFMILLGIAIIDYKIDMPFLNQHSARGFYSFFYGLLFAKYKEKMKLHSWIRVGSTIAVLFIIGMYFSPELRSIIIGYGFEEAYILTFVLYPSLMIILEFPLFQNVFHHKFWGILGESSFDVYIWHVPVLVCFYNIMKLTELSINVHSVSSMIGFAFTVWIIGIISYYWLERKIKLFLSNKYRRDLMV